MPRRGRTLGPEEDQESQSQESSATHQKVRRRRGSRVPAHEKKDICLSSAHALRVLKFYCCLPSSQERGRTWRDESQNNGQWQLTQDDDILVERFAPREKKMISGPGFDPPQTGEHNSIAMFLQKDLDMFFAQTADKNLFLQLMEKDGIVMSSAWLLRLSSALLQRLPCFCLPISPCALAGKHPRLPGGSPGWLV